MTLLENIAMLTVKNSRIPGSGKGLFTDKSIKKDETIIEYKGDKLTWSEVQKRYKKDILDANYLFWVGPNHWIDAELTLRAKARYANDAKGFNKVKHLRNNAEYQVIKNVPYIVATKNIEPDSEILVDYGDDYWRYLKRKHEPVAASKKK